MLSWCPPNLAPRTALTRHLRLYYCLESWLEAGFEAGDVTQSIERLPGMQEALGLSPDVAVHKGNTSPREVEAGGSEMQGPPQLRSYLCELVCACMGPG